MPLFYSKFSKLRNLARNDFYITINPILESLKETLKLKTTAEITELMDTLTQQQINVEATFDNDFFTGKFLAQKYSKKFRKSGKCTLCSESASFDWP